MPGTVARMTTNPFPAAPRPAEDPRPLFASAASTACDVVGRVRPDHLTGPTPCADFDVRALLAHLIAVFRRVAAVGRSEDPFTVPHLVTDVPNDGWAVAARDATAEVEDVWADPAVLTRQLRLPFGVLPGAAALTTYAGEVTTHTWDLAVATGQDPTWDPRVLSVTLAAIRRALPAEGRGAEVPFGPAVPVADDAPAIDRLVAWQGRDPPWRPTPRAGG